MMSIPCSQRCCRYCSVLQAAHKAKDMALVTDLAWQLLSGVLSQLSKLHAMVSQSPAASRAVQGLYCSQCASAWLFTPSRTQH
jgi:hypothetical protein